MTKDIDTDGEKTTRPFVLIALMYHKCDVDKFGCEAKLSSGRAGHRRSYLTHTTRGNQAKNGAIALQAQRLSVMKMIVVKATKAGEKTGTRIRMAGREGGSNGKNTDDDVARIIDDLSEGLMTLE